MLAEISGVTSLGMLVVSVIFGLYLEDIFYEKTINSIYVVDLNYQKKRPTMDVVGILQKEK